MSSILSNRIFFSRQIKGVQKKMNRKWAQSQQTSVKKPNFDFLNSLMEQDFFVCGFERSFSCSPRQHFI